MRAKLFFSLLFCAMTTITFSQRSFIYSDEENVDGGAVLAFSRIIGEAGEYVYLINLWQKEPFFKEQIMVVAFNRATMKKAFECRVFGYPTNNLDDETVEILKKSRIRDAKITRNGILIFWEKHSAVYFVNLDFELKQQGKIRKAIDMSAMTDNKLDKHFVTTYWRGGRNWTYVLYNKETDMLVVGGEIRTGKEEKIMNCYAVFDRDLNLAYEGNVKMPFVEYDMRRKLYPAATYTLGNDNKVYFSYYTGKDYYMQIMFNAEFMLGYIDLENNSVETFEYKDDNYLKFRAKLINLNGGIVAVGLYCDLTLDKTGESAHGVYLQKLDPSMTDVVNEVVFSEFKTEQFTSAVFENNSGDDVKELALKTLKHSPQSVINVIPLGDTAFIVCISSFLQMVEVTNEVGEKSYYNEYKNVFFARVDASGKIGWICGTDAGFKDRKAFSFYPTFLNKNEVLALFNNDDIVGADINTGILHESSEFHGPAPYYFYSNYYINSDTAMYVSKVDKSKYFAGRVLPLKQ